MEIGSELNCLLGLSNKILETSYSEVGLKTEKSGGATSGEGECGEVEEELLASERRSLDILSVKKEAKRSAIEVAADEESKGEADLSFKSLLTVRQRRRGLSDDEDQFGKILFFWHQQETTIVMTPKTHCELKLKICDHLIPRENRYGCQKKPQHYE